MKLCRFVPEKYIVSSYTLLNSGTSSWELKTMMLDIRLREHHR